MNKALNISFEGIDLSFSSFDLTKCFVRSVSKLFSFRLFVHCVNTTHLMIQSNLSCNVDICSCCQCICQYFSVLLNIVLSVLFFHGSVWMFSSFDSDWLTDWFSFYCFQVLIWQIFSFSIKIVFFSRVCALCKHYTV